MIAKAGGEALLERAEKLLNEVRDSQQHPAPHDPPVLTHDYLDSRVMAHLQDTLTLFGLWTDGRPPHELLEDIDLVEEVERTATALLAVRLLALQRAARRALGDRESQGERASQPQA